MILLCFLDHYLRLKARTDWRKKPLSYGRMKLGYVENYGVFKGYMKHQPKKVLKYQTIFVICSVVYTLYVLLTRKNSLMQLGWLMTSLGGINNLWDRAINGYVTDYMSLDGKMYFNIADIFVFAGATLAFLGEIFAMAARPKTVITVHAEEPEQV